MYVHANTRRIQRIQPLCLKTGDKPAKQVAHSADSHARIASGTDMQATTVCVYESSGTFQNGDPTVTLHQCCCGRRTVRLDFIVADSAKQPRRLAGMRRQDPVALACRLMREKI